jgi:hypothetical protein
LNGLPVDLHTQFFKMNDHAVRLSVVAHMDLRLVRFRKQAGRNVNNLTLVTALFDRDGKYLMAKEKTIQFHLLDSTLDRLSHSGISTRTTFEVPPGMDLIREVVRDSEDERVSGLNRTVEFPF